MAAPLLKLRRKFEGSLQVNYNDFLICKKFRNTSLRGKKES